MGERKKVQVWIHRRGEKGREVLILFTSRGEFWQPVTGSVEGGEELAQAALREASEETGLSFVSPPRALDFSFHFDAHGHRFTETCFEIEADPRSEVRLSHEHTALRWIAPTAALAELRHPSNAEALKHLLRRFGQAN